MKMTPKEIEKYLDLLAGNMDHIALITRDASEEQLNHKASKQDWSVRDILAHLRACSDVWGNSIEAMLADENPVLPDVHPRHWSKTNKLLRSRLPRITSGAREPASENAVGVEKIVIRRLGTLWRDG